MGLTNCKLDENDRNEAIRRFEQILGRQNLKFIKEINVAPVSEIGVPGPITLVRKAFKTSGKPAILLRILGLLLSSILVIFNFESYLFVSISLVTSLLFYLWIDSVLLWFDKEKGQVTIKWFMLSILTSLFIVFGIVVFVNPFISAALLNDPPRFWEIELFGIYLTVMTTFIGVFSSYRLYVGLAHFERVLFEGRFVAVRRCLRAINPMHSLGSPDNPTRAALQSEIESACLKYLFLLVVSLSISYFVPFLYPATTDIYLILLCSVSIIGLVILSSLLVRLVKGVKILFRTALTIEIVTLSLVSIPLSFLQQGLLLTGLLYFAGALLLVVIWKSIKETAIENPQLAGQKYFECYLASLNREDALHFVDQTLQKLDTIIPEE